ncbi:MAG: hypothetical protein MUE54_06860 [Anaerolineae bacterium]|nr:hypothetical protein [Anaerolineae bacterium]
MKSFLLVSLFILMSILTACGGGDSNAPIVGGGADTPQDAVEQFLRAVFAGEIERAISFVCNAQREPMRLTYAEMGAAYAALEEVTVDLSGLAYEITSEDVDAGTTVIAITGDVRVVVGTEERLINVDERFKTVNLRQEDELWRVC